MSDSPQNDLPTRAPVAHGVSTVPGQSPEYGPVVLFEFVQGTEEDYVCCARVAIPVVLALKMMDKLAEAVSTADPVAALEHVIGRFDSPERN